MKPERLLVIAPHPDDEVLGCGGYLALHQQRGAEIRVVIVTDGALGTPPGLPPGTRRDESRRGLAALGLTDVIFWDYADGAVPLGGPIVEHYRDAVRAFRPTRILVPAPTERHPDHRRVTRGLLGALEGTWRGEVYFYETSEPSLTPNATVDITPHIELKLQALMAHASQLEQFDYVGHAETLARLRGIAIGRRYAEAYLQYEWDGTPQNFFESRPLISVVLRANDVRYLRHALKSLVAQEYDQLEIVLVWFGEGTPDLGGFELLDLRVVAGSPGRARNLNLGLDAVRGEYVAFLDQDDVVYRDHFALLLAEAEARTDLDAIAAGCRVTSCRLDGDEVEVLGELSVMNRPWEPGRILLGNTVPNHAMLFRAPIFRAHRFDETLGAYEDWEMWGRLEAGGFRFGHLEAVTCEYRLFSPEGVTSVDEEHERRGYKPWREQVLARFLARLDRRHLEHLSALVEGLERANADLERQRDDEQAKRAEIPKSSGDLEALEGLLARGLGAIGVDKAARSGAAALIGRALPAETLFSIIVPIHDTPGDVLAETLFSVRNQAYPGWELCLVDDASTREDTLEVLDAAQKDPDTASRLRVARRPERGGIVAATMDALALGTAPWVVFLDHDDLLHEEALLSLALAIKEGKACALLYTDSRLIDRAGQLLHVYKKSSWAPETLLHLNYINHLTAVRRDALAAIGGFRPEYEGAQDWDLLLRVVQRVSPSEIRHVPEPLYDWRAAEDSLAYKSSAKPWAYEAARRAVEEHLVARGLTEVTTLPNPDGPGFICRWAVRADAVDVIVPTHDNVSGLKKCVEGLLEGTDYPALFLTVVANRAEGVEMQAFLDELAASGRAQVLVDDRPFNWAALNNRALAAGRAPLVLFMNDDVEMTARGWLLDMVRYLQLDGVGAVGATLFYPNGELQHNGIRTDPTWVAANITSWGGKNELSVPRNVSAATGACLLVKRAIVEDVGGFDERLAVSFNDVDFCLAVRSRGARIVQAADVRLVHRESASRGAIDSTEKQQQLDAESAFMRDKWGEFLRECYLPSYEIIAHGTRILRLQ